MTQSQLLHIAKTKAGTLSSKLDLATRSSKEVRLEIVYELAELYEALATDLDKWCHQECGQPWPVSGYRG